MRDSEAAFGDAMIDMPEDDDLLGEAMMEEVDPVMDEVDPVMDDPVGHGVGNDKLKLIGAEDSKQSYWL